jgi:hypothetical protein
MYVKFAFISWEENKYGRNRVWKQAACEVKPEELAGIWRHLHNDMFRNASSSPRVRKCGLDSTGSRYDPVVGSSGHCNELRVGNSSSVRQITAFLKHVPLQDAWRPSGTVFWLRASYFPFTVLLLVWLSNFQCENNIKIYSGVKMPALETGAGVFLFKNRAYVTLSSVEELAFEASAL